MYLLSKIQMMGWLHGLRDFEKQIIETFKNKKDEQNKE
jgi:hypothetical protein